MTDFPIRKDPDGNYYLLRFEDTELEFKQTVKAVCPEDLVAMANGSGGSILIGVEEIRLEDGTKAGRVIGCPLTDELKQNINNKAASCMPSIVVDFEEHWAGGIPFVEVIVPEGRDKPYCSAGGCYRIRVDGGNRALDPPSLVAMVLERESRRFLKRFREATAELEGMLEKIADKLERLEQIEKSSDDRTDN